MGNSSNDCKGPTLPYVSDITHLYSRVDFSEFPSSSDVSPYRLVDIVCGQEVGSKQFNAHINTLNSLSF